MKKKTIKLQAFSLQELLVTLAIMGILILIALPNLMPLINRAKAVEAKQQLIFLHSLQQTNFYTYSKYSNSFEELGFEQPLLITEGGNANYKIEIIDASEKEFKAIATSVIDFDGDGIFNIWEINEKKELKELIGD